MQLRATQLDASQSSGAETVLPFRFGGHVECTLLVGASARTDLAGLDLSVANDASVLLLTRMY